MEIVEVLKFYQKNCKVHKLCMKGGDCMIRFLKRLFRKDNNVLINLNNVNKTLSMSMAGNGNCSDCC